MKDHTGRTLRLITLSSFLMISVLIGMMAYAFWSFNLSPSNSMQNLVETKQNLKKILDTEIESMERALNQGELSYFSASFNQTEKTIMPIAHLSELEFRVWDAHHQKISNELEAIKKYSNAQEAYQVHKNKLQDFKNYSEANRWKTLNQISAKILERFSKSNLNDSNFLNILNIHLKEIKTMDWVTKSSTLNREEKATVEIKLNALLQELSILQEYSLLKEKLKSTYGPYEKATGDLAKGVLGQIALKEMSFQRQARNLLFLMIGLFVTVLFLGFMVFKIQSHLQKKQNSKLESDLLKTVEDILIERKVEALDSLSDGAKHRIFELSDFLARRMSYGKVFQESIPWPCLLLDQNLKVSWANALFCEKWLVKSEEILNGHLSWDQLKTLTNLTENDPVKDALDKNLAGVFQIQYHGKDQTIPYEMSICPVENKGKKSIALFLYGLENQVETINSQVQAVCLPVENCLSFMMSGETNNEFWTLTEQAFARLNQPQIFEGFQRLNALKEKEVHSLIQEVQALENTKDLQKSLITGLESDVQELEKTRAIFGKYIQVLKKRFVDYATSNELLAHLAQESVQEANSFHLEGKKYYAQKQSLHGRLTSLVGALDSLSAIKEKMRHFKQFTQSAGNIEVLLKRNIESFKSSLGPTTKTHQEEILKDHEKIKGEISKDLAQFELMLSKITMLFEQSPIEEFSQDPASNFSREHWEVRMKEACEIAEDVESHVVSVITEMQKHLPKVEGLRARSDSLNS